jgi:NADH-quinone oxidoreductase subunit E
MAVRRLAETQPESFAFTPENAAWADRQIAKFPEGRQASAVISLLWRAQEQEGWVTRPMIEKVAETLGMPLIRVLEVATFYTMFHLEPVGRKAHVQVCGTTPCMLSGSDDIIDICRKRIASHPHEVSRDGDFSWEEVECLGACVNAPMVQVGKDTYEDLTRESFTAILDAFARGERPRPGPQNGRQFSMPITGATTLNDIEYADDDVRPSHGERANAGREPARSPAAPVPPSASEDYPPGEHLRMKQNERAAAAPSTRGGADPRGPATEAQEIGRVDPTGRSDEAAARGVGEEPGKPQGHAAKEPLRDTRTGSDRAAQPRSDRDSETGDKG